MGGLRPPAMANGLRPASSRAACTACALLPLLAVLGTFAPPAAFLSQLAPRIAPPSPSTSLAAASGLQGTHAAPAAPVSSGSRLRAAGAAVVAVAFAALAASARRQSGNQHRAASVVACRWSRRTENYVPKPKFPNSHTPKQIPVLDLDGKQIGEETMDFYTLSTTTANYVVHQNISNFLYMRDYWPGFVPRRSDLKKGKKPWKQKGGGKARHGSRASPLFGKSKAFGPYGLDSKRNKRNRQHTNYRCISTVLMSKWKNIKLVQGLEDFTEPSQTKLTQIIKNCFGTEHAEGKKYTLLVTRHGYGEENVHFPDRRIVKSPLYLAGRLIPRLGMRRPRDLDPKSDGLFQVLKARRILMSREAFFDMVAKYHKETGWALKTPEEIEIEQLQKLAKEYPRADRKAEIEAVQQLPFTCDEREFWAKAMREKMAAETSG